MIKSISSGLRLFALLTILTGVIYPLFVTVASQVAFPSQANGNLIEKEGVVIGSSLIGQNTTDPRYFWSRPSAVNYMLGSSGATNLSTTSTTLADRATAYETAFREANGLSDDVFIPNDMIFASASGLDPHISPESARLQIDRVATARNLDRQIVADLVESHLETPQFGILGQTRVNVLLLNVALDQLEG
jgi:K+-transporting ATPase ATPase C chain